MDNVPCFMDNVSTFMDNVPHVMDNFSTLMDNRALNFILTAGPGRRWPALDSDPVSNGAGRGWSGLVGAGRGAGTYAVSNRMRTPEILMFPEYRKFVHFYRKSVTI